MHDLLLNSIRTILSKTISNELVKEFKSSDDGCFMTLIDFSIIEVKNEEVIISLVSADKEICRPVTNLCLQLKARDIKYKITQNTDILAHKLKHEHLFLVTISTKADGVLQETEELYVIKSLSSVEAITKALAKEGLPYYEDSPHTAVPIHLNEEGICHVDTVYLGYENLIGGVLDELFSGGD